VIKNETLLERLLTKKFEAETSPKDIVALKKAASMAINRGSLGQQDIDNVSDLIGSMKKRMTRDQQDRVTGELDRFMQLVKTEPDNPNFMNDLFKGVSSILGDR